MAEGFGREMVRSARLAVAILGALFGVWGASRAVGAISITCAEGCQTVAQRLIEGRALEQFPVLASEPERFDAENRQCPARADAKPMIHAVVVSPFHRHFIEMPGTQNDAELWRSVFEQRGGEVTVLKGDQTTREKVIAAMTDIVPCIRERDLVIFTFSGGAASFSHWGGLDPDVFLAELCQGTDLADTDRSAVCTADDTANVMADAVADTNELVLFTSEANITLTSMTAMTPDSRVTGLRSSEMSNFATQIRNRGGDVIFVLDTNFAEGAWLVAQQDEARLNAAWRWTYGEKPEETVAAPVPLFGSGELGALYASRSDQLAYEKPQGTGGLQLGDLSYAVTEALRNFSNPTIEQLARETDRIMRDGESKQDAVFEATNPSLRLLSTRETPQSNPNQIEVINPKMRSALAMATPELEVVARYTGTQPARFASIDGLNVEIDPSGQFRRTVKLDSRLELPIRIYGDKASLLAERRIQFDVDAAKASLAPAGRRFALIIANQNYENFDKLANPIADAEAVRKVLVEKYGFATTIETAPGKSRDLVLNDATATDIKRALFDLRKSLIAEDQLLIYYAGHGQQDSESTSYWVPVDATTEDFTWIAASDISEDLRKLSAGSVLLISDSCYAGGLSRSLDEPAPADEARGRFLAKAAQYKARQLIASGGDEPVQDGGGGAHSLFARALLESLNEMPEAVFTASELFNNTLKPKAVSLAFSSSAQGQTPAHLRLTRAGDQPESEFIFVRK